MGLEADDGRPEASPPLRGVVQAADRAALRERQAGARDQGRVRHLAFHAAPLVQGIRNSGSTKAADNRTLEQNEPVELRKRNRQLEMEVDVSEQAALIFARK